MNDKINLPEIQNLIKNEENKIVNELDNKKKQFLEENEKKFKEMNLKFEKTIDNLNSSLDKLQNKLIFYNLITEDLVKKISGDKIILTLSYAKPNFENKENEDYFPIRGGCLPKINDKIFLNENEEFNEKLYDSLINSSNFQFKNNKKKYFIVKTELRNGFIFGELLNHFTRIIDKNQIMLQIASISDENIPKNILTKKDMSGNSIAIYKLIMNEINEESFPTKEELNCKNNFDESPELFSIALNKPKLTKKLLSLPNSNFSSKTEGGLTPLALSLINDSREETKLLLNNIHKIGDLNSTNELGLILTFSCNE